MWRDYSDVETSSNSNQITMDGTAQQVLGPNVHRIGLILSVAVTTQAIFSFGKTGGGSGGIIMQGSNTPPFQVLLSQFGKAILQEIYVVGQLGKVCCVTEFMCLCGIRLNPFKADIPIVGTSKAPAIEGFSYRGPNKPLEF